MDDILLLDAVERYTSGEMSQQEQMLFEELRKSNPEVDQLVVEQSYFLHELNRYGAAKNYRHALHEVEAKLSEEGLIKAPQLKGMAKVTYLWKRYKRNVAVAASIAGLISLATTGLVVSYTKKSGNENYLYLVNKINQTNKEINKLKSSSQLHNIPARTPEPKVDYRGTGFLIDNKGYLVTNSHVVERMKNVYVENNKGEYFTTSVIYIDKNSDLAILKITDTSFSNHNTIPYSIKKSNSDLGEQIFTLGFPKSEVVYGEGYLSAKSGNEGDSTAYQLSVSANPGNSGGPVINRNGEIIGIITGKDIKADGVVYAAKSKNIFKLIDELKKTDSTQNIKAPTGSGLRGLDRVQQVKKMEEFVFMVVGN